ncbi:hypothetical protein [Schlesneria paludicola]|uniref:hypothetical protein n=1 Tax=Schlesneria paludicola TaxID=360056 RepID=UPI00029AEE74|nr:hypothetical protein [Schlesneria paludicola]
MANQEWRDRLWMELSQRNLPAFYAARLFEELTDHFTDIEQEDLSMDALTSAEERLGAPALLAQAAEKEYRKRTFAGRHPVLMFALLPLPAVTVTWIATMIVCGLGKSLVTPLLPVKCDPPTLFEWGVAYASMYVVRFLPFLLMAWLFTSLGRRANRRGWSLLACGFVAVFALFVHIHLREPDDQYNLMVCCGPEFGFQVWPARLLQAGVPLAVGLWGWHQAARSRTSAQGGDSNGFRPPPRPLPSRA